MCVHENHDLKPCQSGGAFVVLGAELPVVPGRDLVSPSTTLALLSQTAPGHPEAVESRCADHLASGAIVRRA